MGPTAGEGQDDLEARLQGLVGMAIGSSHAGPDPVNQPMIRHWAAAFEDANPVYVDEEAAARSRFGGIVAPPLMLQTWTMPTPILTGIKARGGAPTPSDGESPITVLDRAGYLGTLATNSSFEILRYLRPGDVVSTSTVIESVSEEKQTRLGPGRFVTWVSTYTDAEGQVVGRQTFRILKFRTDGAAS